MLLTPPVVQAGEKYNCKREEMSIAVRQWYLLPLDSNRFRDMWQATNLWTPIYSFPIYRKFDGAFDSLISLLFNWIAQKSRPETASKIDDSSGYHLVISINDLLWEFAMRI
jgi:hypothetical protein